MTQWRLILSIARTHLTTKMKSTVTAALGVTFGIGAYITLVSFMTGLNRMLEDLVLNQTRQIHLYNEEQPSAEQPLERSFDFRDDLLQIRSVKPKQGQLKIHNALPILKYLKSRPGVIGATPQLRAQIFYLSGPLDLGGVLIGVDILEEERLSNLGDYIIQGHGVIKVSEIDWIFRFTKTNQLSGLNYGDGRCFGIRSLCNGGI